MDCRRRPPVVSRIALVYCPVSHTPTLFKALAALLFLAAIAHPIVGRARLKRFLESLASWPPWAIRLPCLLGVALGGFLLWSISSAIGAA